MVWFPLPITPLPPLIGVPRWMIVLIVPLAIGILLFWIAVF